MERIRHMLEGLKKERRDDLSNFILSILETLAPSPKDLRDLADLVNIDRIKSTDDPEILIKNFNKVETSLRQWAEVMEILYANKGKHGSCDS